jgi:hypothetical protein
MMRERVGWDNGVSPTITNSKASCLKRIFLWSYWTGRALSLREEIGTRNTRDIELLVLIVGLV